MKDRFKSWPKQRSWARVSALVLAILFAGCTGEETGQHRIDTDQDRQILQLQAGISPEAVEQMLGIPDYERELDYEILYYGLWQLQFGENGLERRIKSSGVESRVSERVMDRYVRNLVPGAGVTQVRAHLGEPSAFEIFDNGRERTKSFWYGRWKLTFVEGKLETRSAS